MGAKNAPNCDFILHAQVTWVKQTANHDGALRAYVRESARKSASLTSTCLRLLHKRLMGAHSSDAKSAAEAAPLEIRMLNRSAAVIFGVAGCEGVPLLRQVIEREDR